MAIKAGEHLNWQLVLLAKWLQLRTVFHEATKNTKFTKKKTARRARQNTQNLQRSDVAAAATRRRDRVENSRASEFQTVQGHLCVSLRLDHGSAGFAGRLRRPLTSSWASWLRDKQA